MFDATRGAPSLWIPAAGLVFVLIGFVFLRSTQHRFFRLVFIGFGVLWTVLATVGVLGFWLIVHSEVASGAPKQLVGTVQDFVPLPSGGHGMEQFTLNGVAFQYSDYVVTPGFNTTSAAGGPMREGLQVRLEYLPGADPIITRLEVGC